MLARRATIALCALAAVAALAFLVWALVIGDDPSHLGPTARGLWLVSHGRLRLPAVAGALAIAGACAVLAWYARRGGAALLAIAIASPLGIALAWIARTMVARMEDPRFRAKSPYVHGATLAAIAATAFLVPLAVTSLVAYLQQRRA